MIWSSSNPNGTTDDLVTKSMPASDWTWDELGGCGVPRGQDMADREALHAEEVEHAYRRGRLEGEEVGRGIDVCTSISGR